MKTIDLVVIGSGAAGMAAAVEARKNGVEDILILEKDGQLGGILNQCIHNGFGLTEFKEELTGPEYWQRFVDQVKELKINYTDIVLLKPYERNAKIHTKKQIAKIIQSMKTFGVVTPILVNKDYEVIAGHGRLEALKELGYTKVPVIMLEHLSENQVKAYRLADNKIAQDATYDEELLKIELQELII